MMLKKYRISSVIFLLSICGGLASHAQPAPFLEKHDVSTGFPSNGIYMSATDANGFIWLAASGGIIRFDGKNTFCFNRFNSPILEDDITGIRHYTSDTLLFYGSGYIGLTRNYIVYKNQSGRFNIEVRSLNQLVIAGNGPQDQLYECSDRKVSVKISRADLQKAIQSGFFSGADLQHVYAYINGSMYYFANGTYTKFEQKKETLPYDYIFLIGNKFIQIRPGGEFGVFTPGVGMQYKTNRSLDSLLFMKSKEGPYIRKLNRPKNSENMLTSDHNEVFQLTLTKSGDLEFLKIIDQIDVSGISNISFDDIGKRYIMSTLDEGLKIYKIPNFNSIPKDVIVPRKDNYITSLIALSNDTLFTTYGVIGSKGKFINDLRESGPKQGSNALLRESDSIIYQKGSAVYSFHLKKRKQQFVFNCPFRISCFFRARNGALWISGYSELAKQKKDTVETIFPYIKGNENGVILKLKELDPGYIEILSNIGSFRLELKTLKISRNECFGKLKVLDFLHDGNSIWMAAYGDGIYRCYQGKIFKLPLDQEGNLVFAQNIIYDGHGWFWYSTNNGIVKVSKADLEAYCINSEAPVSIISYNLQDGLLSNVLYGNGNPSVSMDTQGNLYYPSVKGIVYTNVFEMPHSHFKPEIFIDEIKTEDSAYAGTQINLSYGFKNLTVKTSIPNLGSKGNLYSFYKIEGFSDHWTPLNQNGLIEVNSLPSGPYTLIIRYSYYDSKLKHSIWVSKYIYIQVAFPFYRKWWFMLFALLVLSLLFYLIYRSRVRILIQRKKILENAVEERTIELRNSIENYQKTTEQLYRNQQVFDNLFSTVLHDLSSPLRFLGLLSSRLKLRWTELPREEVEKELDALNASTEEASHIAQDMLVWMKSQKEALEFKKVRLPLSQLISDHIKIYKWIAEEKGIRMQTMVSESLFLEVNEELLGILIRNLVDNAVKYAQTGTIEITAYQQDAEVHIDIIDQGRGMPETQITELNKGINPFKVDAAGKLGFRLILKLIQSMEGTLNFSNRAGGGLKVKIKLPLK